MSKGQGTQGGAVRTPDEIERKIYGGEYAHDVTLRQLYGNLSLDEIKRIPKFRRDNRALFGLLVTAEVVTHKEGHGRAPTTHPPRAHLATAERPPAEPQSRRTA